MAVVAIAVIVGTALFHESILIGIGVMLSERRPPLLDDAVWGERSSAKKFGTRFAPGTPETDLLAWLADNRFTVDRETRLAKRRIGGMPCAEEAIVTWRTDATGRLRNSDATVTEAGCL